MQQTDESQPIGTGLAAAGRRLAALTLAAFERLAAQQYAAPWRIPRHDVTHKW